MVAEPSQYSSDFGHSFKMKINEISLYFNGLRFHLSILPKSNYLPLCCFTGLSFTDMKNLTKDNLQTSFDGKLWIMTKRQKTGVESNIMLLDIPKQIIEKYDGMAKEDYLLPVPQYITACKNIKKIIGLCGIEKEITWHTSRHTMATEICLTNGVPIETLSKMLGHTNIRTTQIYAKITHEKESRDMAALSDKLSKIEQFNGITI